MRVYNQKLSKEVNAQLSRRDRAVHIQRRMIAIAAILIVSIVILLGTSIRAFASSQNEPKEVYKYYTSIPIEKGDTLWTIADEYIDGYQVSKTDYIREVCELNHISGDEIRAGQYLIVICYSAEKR